VTVETHSRVLAAGGEDPRRIAALATWPGTDLFTDAERSALALAEAVTRIADRTDPVPDEVWDEAAKHYDEKCLAGLLLAIASINLWNRLNVATHQVNPL
jgi:alkylhydroperoxidase family enzyme